jgi:hypothetical protein
LFSRAQQKHFKACTTDAKPRGIEVSSSSLASIFFLSLGSNIQGRIHPASSTV